MTHLNAMPGHLEIIVGESSHKSDASTSHIVQLRDVVSTRGGRYFGNVYLLSFDSRFSQQQVAILAQQLGLPANALSMSRITDDAGQLDAAVLADLAAWMHQALVFGERIAVAVPAGGKAVADLLLAGIRIRNGSAETSAIEARFGDVVKTGGFTPESFDLLVAMFETGKLHHSNERELSLLRGQRVAAHLMRFLDRYLQGGPVLVEQQGSDQAALTFTWTTQGADALACTIQLIEDPAVIAVRVFAPARLVANENVRRQAATTVARLNQWLSPDILQFDNESGAFCGSSVAVLDANRQLDEGLVLRLIGNGVRVITEAIPVISTLVAEDWDRYEAAVQEHGRKAMGSVWML